MKKLPIGGGAAAAAAGAAGADVGGDAVRAVAAEAAAGPGAVAVGASSERFLDQVWCRTLAATGATLIAGKKFER